MTVTRSPLRTDSAVRLASSAEGGDLDPAGDVLAAAAGDLDGQAEFDAGGAVAGGEGAGVIAEAAGDGDGDGVHGFLLVCGREDRPPWWRPGGLRCPSRRSGARDAGDGARTPGGPGRPRCFPAGGPKKAAPAKPVPAGLAAAGERSVAARGERSESPVAGTEAAAQADQPG